MSTNYVCFPEEIRKLIFLDMYGISLIQSLQVKSSNWVSPNLKVEEILSDN